MSALIPALIQLFLSRRRGGGGGGGGGAARAGRVPKPKVDPAERSAERSLMNSFDDKLPGTSDSGGDAVRQAMQLLQEQIKASQALVEE